MPRRDDLKTIAIIGSGPIVIGQACEFDYSGVQALKVLREEGYRTVLINSNPATIMTDPDWADATYLEPLDLEGVTAVLRRERPDALLPTLGGQTALNLAMELERAGVLDELGIELIGASAKAIHTAEDREAFEAMASVGLRVPRSVIVRTPEARAAISGELQLPVAIRPAFTLGGHGGGFARTQEELEAIVARGLSEPDLAGARRGVGGGLGRVRARGHPRPPRQRRHRLLDREPRPDGRAHGRLGLLRAAMTLSDREYQALRDAAVKVIRAVGVETGGSNVQFGVNRETGEIVVIEMNPRVSRSSARWPPKAPATRSPRSRPASRSATRWTRSRTTSRARRRPPSSRRSTTSSSRRRASRSRSSPAPTRR